MSPGDVEELKNCILMNTVKRAIGRMKTSAVLKDTITLSLSRLSHQVVCVCTLNLKPVLQFHLRHKLTK